MVEIELYSSFTGKHRLIVDYGQERKTSFRKDCTIKEVQEDMFFNSPMHGINYICQFGYEVVEIVRRRESDLDGDRYLLKKVKKQ